MTFKSGAGLDKHFYDPPHTDGPWKDTVLATWGQPKQHQKDEAKPQQKDEPKQQQKTETQKVPMTKKELEQDPLIQWILPKPEVWVSRGDRVGAIVFSNGDTFKMGGREGWTLTDKNGKEVKIVERLDHGESTTHSWRLSNGATYHSGCFTDGISYPNGEGVTFRNGILSYRGGEAKPYS